MSGQEDGQGSPHSGSRLNEYFLVKDGISREVISADINSWLGNDALVRPGVYDVGDGTVLRGYFIRAYRNLTTSMIADLKEASHAWENELWDVKHRDREKWDNDHQNDHLGDYVQDDHYQYGFEQGESEERTDGEWDYIQQESKNQDSNSHQFRHTKDPAAYSNGYVSGSSNEQGTGPRKYTRDNRVKAPAFDRPEPPLEAPAPSLRTSSSLLQQQGQEDCSYGLSHTWEGFPNESARQQDDNPHPPIPHPSDLSKGSSSRHEDPGLVSDQLTNHSSPKAPSSQTKKNAYRLLKLLKLSKINKLLNLHQGPRMRKTYKLPRHHSRNRKVHKQSGKRPT